MRKIFVVLVLIAFNAFGAGNTGDIYVVRSPSGGVQIRLRKLGLSEDGRTRTRYFYVVSQATHHRLLYLDSDLEDSADGERTKFLECIKVHWSPSESAFVLQERFPADSPSGRLHIIANVGTGLTALPYDSTMPPSVVRNRKRHPERYHPYAPRTVVEVTDSAATIDFGDYRYTYRYRDRGVPRR